MKKKTVKMISAVAVLGVLCGTYAGINAYVSSQEAKEAEIEDDSIDVLSVELDSVTSVAFTADMDDVEFEKQDDAWIEKSDKEFPVSQDSVDSAVNGIISLTADQEITDVEDLSQYDLDVPQNTIILKTEDGESVLEIGMESSGSYYVKNAEEDSIVYLVASTYIDPFMGKLYDFAESGTFPSITSAAITDIKVEKEEGYELSQNADDLSWNISDGKNEEKADSTKASTVTSAIGSLAYDDFVDYNCTDNSKYGFDAPYAVVTVKYTEEETIEDDTEEISEESDTEDVTAEDAEDSDEEEPKTITVDKEMTIYIGDESDSGRYVKVDDSKEVYTITEDSLEDIIECSVSDFYSLSVSYVSLSDLSSLKIQSADDTHEIAVIKETTNDEDGEEITTTTYELDGEETEESAFTTFYNKLNNITAQERLDEEYDPEEDPAYSFVYKKADGDSITVEYYVYDTNFYAAVVENRVYLVNKMNIRDLEDAYEKMVNPEESED